MRNIRLIILLCVLGGIVAVIITLTAVFTVYSTDARCMTDYGDDKSMIEIIDKTNAEVTKVADEFKYTNIFLLNEQSVIDAVNEKVLTAEATRVECVFPNKIIVHYNLLTEDVQIQSGDKYLITSSTGKILKVNDYDSTDKVNSEHYSDTLIRLIPNEEVHSQTVGTYISDTNGYDRSTLSTMLSTVQKLQDKNGDRVFNKGSIAEIDLTSKNTITLKMRLGVKVRLLGGVNRLEEKIQTLASWYVYVEEYKTMSGTATISDANPQALAYSP